MGITRRGLLGRAGVATCTVLGVGALAGAAEAADHTLYMLDPDTAASGCAHGCGGCNACRLHAANSYFADADSADLHRAHPYCRCHVVAGPTVSADTFGVLFGAAPTIARPRVDLRTVWVRDALADALVPPPNEATTNRAPGSVEPATQGPPSSSPVALRVVRLRVWQPVPRQLRLLLEIDAAAHVHARLAVASGRRVGRFAFRADSGVTTHDLAAPNGAPPGAYVLRVRVVSAGGAVQTFERPLTIAAPMRASIPPPPKFDPLTSSQVLGRLPVLTD
ncbi:MAG TPA: hypothetical protein VGF46_10640 [Gaiellales bacterium]|jgi:hypothetical protein